MTTTTTPATTSPEDTDTAMTETATAATPTPLEDTAATPTGSSSSTAPPRRTSRVRHPAGERPLTDAEAAALAARMPDDPVRLGPDDLACAACGVTVRGPLDIASVTWDDPTSAELPGGVLSNTSAGLPAEPLTTCEECAARRHLAHDLSARLLPTGLAMGGVRYGPEHAAELVAAALDVLAALGAPAPSPARLTRDELVIIVRRLAPLGTALGWSSRFAPVRAADARPGTAAPRPWGHVRESTRLGLRRAYVHAMADRLALSAPPVALAPPPLPPSRSLPVPGGCLVCGVASVSLPAVQVARAGGREAAARDVWHYASSVAPDSLGGRAGPTRLSGHTCPPCAEAVAHAGAWGPSARERALLVALGLASRWSEGADALAGAVGWAGLFADAARRSAPLPEPNLTPWAHLGDLDELRDRLAAGLALGGAR